MADRNRPTSGFCLFWACLCLVFTWCWALSLSFGKTFRSSWIARIGSCLGYCWWFILSSALYGFGKVDEFGVEQKRGYFFITMKKLVLLPHIFGLLAVLGSCNNPQPQENQTIVGGKLQVLVDETLLPVMEEQVAVFEHLYKQADVELSVAQENQIVTKLVNNEVEVAVLTRQLNAEEMTFFEARQFRPRVYRFAEDALALVVNKNSADSVITVDDIIRVMQGKEPVGQVDRLVFDNPNSSTVRYLKDLAGVDSLPATGVYALKSNSEVLKYVYETPRTVGVLGLSWVVRPDSALRRYTDGVKVLGVRSQAGKPGADGYYKPSQSNLAEGIYPLSRSVYIINAEPRKGLGMGFAAFLTGLSGQRIILKSGLMPDSLPPRELIIRK